MIAPRSSFAIAEHFDDAGGGREAERLAGQVEPRARERDALVSQRREIQPLDMQGRAAGLAGAQHLLDGVQEPVAVFQHDRVELAPLRLRQRRFAGQECFQMEPNGRHGRLEFMRDGVDERIVLFVPPDFADQEGGVQNQAGDDGGEDEHAEDQGRDLPPGHDHPADVQGRGQRHEGHPEDDEEGDRPAPPRNYRHDTDRIAIY